MGGKKQVVRLVPPDTTERSFHRDRVRSFQPPDLNRKEGVVFRRLALDLSESGRMEKRFASVIADYARIKIAADELESWLKENGSFYTTTHDYGQVSRERPQSIKLDRMKKMMLAIYKDLGLTPMAEKRISTGKPEEQANPFRDIK